jgi:hypothetical protein
MGESVCVTHPQFGLGMATRIRLAELTPALKLRYHGFGVDVRRLLRLPGTLPMYRHFSPRAPWQIRVRENDACGNVCAVLHGAHCRSCCPTQVHAMRAARQSDTGPQRV